jgi:hypothetical protein
MEILPTPKLDPQSQPWGRRVTKKAEDTERGLASLTTQVDLSNKGLAAQLNRLQQQVGELQDVNSELQETVDLLEALSPVTSASSTGLTGLPAAGWTTDSGLRPSISVSTPTGKLRITLSALLAFGIVTFEIPGYITRSSNFLTTDSTRMLMDSVGSLMIATKEVLVTTGLPVSTPFTVQAECYGFSGSPIGMISASAGFVTISAQAIP